MNPDYWRARAEEARAHASEMHTEEARRAMLEIAALYERIATTLIGSRSGIGAVVTAELPGRIARQEAKGRAEEIAACRYRVSSSGKRKLGLPRKPPKQCALLPLRLRCSRSPSFTGSWLSRRAI